MTEVSKASQPSLVTRAKSWARAIRCDVGALWLAARDRRTPWYAKVTAGAVVAYALSPIDLIPDFIPVIGYLDDLLIVPLGIKLAASMVPPALMAEFREKSSARANRPRSVVGALLVGAIWAVCSVLILLWLWRYR